MRTLPLLAALFLSSPIALASTELERLQERCAEQERQILQLEEENSRLKSLMDTAAATPMVRSSSPAPSATPSISEKSAPGETSSPTHATVRPGDSLSKVAKRNGTTPEALIKLNKLKNPSLIRPGQKLLLPAKASAPAPRSSAPVGGSHIVKSGDTFYSIARQHGLSVDSLAAANPSVKATALRPGQKLLLTASPATSREAVAAKTLPAAKPAATISTASAVTRLDTAASAPAPLVSSSRTVSSAPRIRSVLVTEETDFGSFAAAHGTTTEKLNALNGHRLKSSTVLAKGSEFYVPAQP
jgi:LysM repeat protein